MSGDAYEVVSDLVAHVVMSVRDPGDRFQVASFDAITNPHAEEDAHAYAKRLNERSAEEERKKVHLEYISGYLSRLDETSLGDLAFGLKAGGLLIVAGES